MGNEKLRKFDDNKLRYMLIPLETIKGLAEVFTYGAKKYGDYNWMTATEEDMKRYQNALMRHWMAYLEGETIDKESGLHHLKHLLTNCSILLWFSMNNKTTNHKK